MNEEQIEWLKENLSLKIRTEEHYTYCGGDGPLYSPFKIVELWLSGEVISEISFE